MSVEISCAAALQEIKLRVGQGEEEECRDGSGVGGKLEVRKSVELSRG